MKRTRKLSNYYAEFEGVANSPVGKEFDAQIIKMQIVSGVHKRLFLRSRRLTVMMVRSVHNIKWLRTPKIEQPNMLRRKRGNWQGGGKPPFGRREKGRRRRKRKKRKKREDSARSPDAPFRSKTLQIF